jgi:methyltransferase family protein
MAEVMRVGEDVRAAARYVAQAVRPALGGEGWDRTAANAERSRRDTLDHISNALCTYSAHLANGLTQRLARRPRSGDPGASPAELVEMMVAFAGVLAAVAETVPSSLRGFHPAGMADRDGFVAMGSDEILVHGSDLAASFGLGYAPPGDLAARVLTRLFPWAPEGVDPWQGLLWANGRIALDGHSRLDPDWGWHCAPLGEWDGTRKRSGALGLSTHVAPGADPGDVTLATYEAAADTYRRHDPPLQGPLLTFLDLLVSRLARAARVLELGSGTGRDARYLESRGLTVIRSDAAAAFLELLRVDGHDARKLDIRTDPFGGPYDAVYANAVFLHLRRPDFPRVLVRARDAVVEGGLLAFTLKEGDGEGWSTAKLELPRHFTYWRGPAVLSALAESGWAVLSVDRAQGRLEPWLHVMAERQ